MFDPRFDHFCIYISCGCLCELCCGAKQIAYNVVHCILELTLFSLFYPVYVTKGLEGKFIFVFRS